MKITWYGLACFYLEGENAKVLIDPFDNTVGYPVPSLYADVWTCSHDHYDHNYKECITNDSVEDGLDGYDNHGVKIKSVKTLHDKEGGSVWGDNLIYIIEMDGLRIAHSGDLGHELSDEQLSAIGPIDILLITTGGIFTIDAKEAAEVAKAINPRLTIPMHYSTYHLENAIEEFSFELEQGIDDFVDNMDCECVQLDTNSLEVDFDALPEKSVRIFTLA